METFARSEYIASNTRRLGSLAMLFGIGVVLSGCGVQEPLSSDGRSTVEPRFLLLVDRDGFCPAGGGADVTFRIDPAAPEPVSAVRDDGRIMHVRWPVGFYGGTALDPVVLDAAGQIVARDGERLIRPPNGAFSDLHGHSACFGGDTLWIQDQKIE
ncbi:MAG: hypothetical protein H0V73_00830 [Chloroflexi bacterium]|nr:hypothetical protein [Chloroflexota bacterium]